jgi:hypothetical protein
MYTIETRKDNRYGDAKYNAINPINITNLNNIPMSDGNMKIETQNVTNVIM